MKPANLILAAGALYLGYRWWSGREPAPAPAISRDTISPMLAPETVTDKTIDAASQFVTKDLVSWMGGKAVN